MKWPLVRIEKVALVNPRLPREIDETQIVSFIGMASVSEDGKLLSEEDRVLAETKKGFTYFSRQDVLLAKITPCFENGKSLYPGQISHELGFGSTEFHVIRANPDELDARYLFYLIWSDSFRFYGQHAMSGAAGQKRVSADFVKKFEIPLPPLKEQIRIAAILDKVEDLRQKRQKAINLVDEFLRAVYLDMFGDPTFNPKGFPVGTIRDLVETANYGTSAKASESEGAFPILRMGNITYEGGWDFNDLKYVDLDQKGKEKYLAQKGDLLFNRTNSKELVGKAAIFNEDDPMAIAGYLIRVRANPAGNNYYISGYLNSKHGKATLMNMCKSIVGMANINAQEMQDIKILIPPASLQRKYENIVRSVDERKVLLSRSLTNIDLLARSLSQAVFSGRL